MRTLYLGLSLILILLSCVEERSKSKSLKELGNVTFNIGFPVSGNYEYFREASNEYIGFVDFNSSKKIAIHSLPSGKQHKVVPLKEVSTEENFIDFLILDLNNYLLLTKYTNKIYLIDSLGRLKKKSNYSSFLTDGIRLSAPLQKTKKGICASISYLATSSNKQEKELNFNDLITYQRKKNQHPLVFNINNLFTPNESIFLALDSVYSRFVKEDELATEGFHGLITNENFIFISTYSDSLYVFNNNYNLDTIVQVSSRFTDINARPIKRKEYMQNPEMLSKNFWDHSFIDQVMYDWKNEVYYCFIRQKMIGKALPFSILVIDKKFNKVNEFDIGHDYVHLSGFMTDEGLYLLSKDNQNALEKKFILFRYE